MNTKASKLYDEFFDKWINRFVPDKGDNRLECEYALHKLIEALQEDKWISVDSPPKIHKDFEDETIMTTIEGFLITDGEKVVITKLVPEFWKTLGFKTIHWQPLPVPPTKPPKKQDG